MEKRRLGSVNSLHNQAGRTPSGAPAHNTDNAGASVAVCGCSGGKVQVNNDHQGSEAAVADADGTSGGGAARASSTPGDSKIIS